MPIQMNNARMITINSNETNDSPIFETFDFKHIGGNYISIHEININATMQEFLKFIKKTIAIDCNLCEENTQIDENILNNIDIIEAGQYNNINSRNPEAAPALEPSNKLFKYYFDKRIDYTSFYVRIN